MKEKNSKEFLNDLKEESMQNQFECNLCDVNFKTIIQLQNHTKSVHARSCATQTVGKVFEDKKLQTLEVIQIFETYECFYCSEEILCEEQLIKHNVNCHELEIVPPKCKSPTLNVLSPQAPFFFPVGFPSFKLFQDLPIPKP